MSALEDTLLFQIKAAGLPEPEREYRFHPVRKWRFDLAWPSQQIAVEVQGGTWVQGKHSRGQGHTNDCEKMNTAQIMGWIVLSFTGDMITSGEALQTIEEVLL